MPCIGCGRGFHSECEIGCENCHGDYEQVTKSISHSGVGQPLKDPKNVKDPYSTGRKRAATMYPLYETNPCEWRGLKNCGGGLEPIIGCMKGLQEARHHGPVKAPLENYPGNVHRICTTCHNRWHKKNDPVYNEEVYRTLLHNPTVAIESELALNEVEWANKK